MNKYLKLGKFTISLPVALTGFLGYFMAKAYLDLSALYAVLGIFLLALGSGALNQVQERHTDARMQRTSHRPLPAGDISLASAIVFVILTALAGTSLLLLTGSMLALSDGLTSGKLSVSGVQMWEWASIQPASCFGVSATASAPISGRAWCRCCWACRGRQTSRRRAAGWSGRRRSIRRS